MYRLDEPPNEAIAIVPSYGCAKNGRRRGLSPPAHRRQASRHVRRHLSLLLSVFISLPSSLPEQLTHEVTTGKCTAPAYKRAASTTRQAPWQRYLRGTIGPRPRPFPPVAPSSRSTSPSACTPDIFFSLIPSTPPHHFLRSRLDSDSWAVTRSAHAQ